MVTEDHSTQAIIWQIIFLFFLRSAFCVPIIIPDGIGHHQALPG
jgi:hypothetical protein